MIWSAYSKLLAGRSAASPVGSTVNVDLDDFLLAMNGFSIEIGISESESLNQLAYLIPENTEVFLNVLPKDRIGERIRICQQIRSLGMFPVPHIAARQMTEKREVQQTLDKFVQQGGATDFLIIAGDYLQPSGEIADSLEFIHAIRPDDSGVRRLGVAGYPEGHPQIPDNALDKALREKMSALQSLGIEPFVVTQFSFNADAISLWCNKFHSSYPDIQIRVGLPGPARLTTLLRFAQRCGVRSSIKKLRDLSVSGSLKLVQRVPPVNQALAVGKHRDKQNNNTAAHLFTFGGLEASLEWVNAEISERMAWPK